MGLAPGGAWGAGAAWAENGRSAPDRRFRQDLSIEYLNSFILPSQVFEVGELGAGETDAGRTDASNIATASTVGGLSAVTYDRQTGQFYALSDDRRDPPNSARIYELNLELDPGGNAPGSPPGDRPQLIAATVTRQITLKDANGQPYSGGFDPEGLALSPSGSFFVSTEGNPAQGLAPGIFEFARDSGALLGELPVPTKYQPGFTATGAKGRAQTPAQTPVQTPVQNQGTLPNQGFEALTLSATGSAPGDPLRLFVATEGPLVQDKPRSGLGGTARDRLLHYYLETGSLGDGRLNNGQPTNSGLGQNRPQLIAEHLYPLDPLPGSLFHGLSEILALDGEGHFLAMERALTPLGFDIKLFQITLAGASDISTVPSLGGNLRGIVPIAKQRLLHLNDLGIALDNLEGMSWGPRLGDGSRSLLLISDDNFKSFQKTQILLFKVNWGA
ncbi:MAG: esterase-like activity of phytase family protein [Synechococcales cyanobacterium RM1_1_8]|nr:esterase-like activity of phytase family protein [Synechococcales cyanobacterium RM1_1_8]